MLFSIFMRKTKLLSGNIFLHLPGLARKSRSKEATLKKESYYINISKLEYVLL